MYVASTTPAKFEANGELDVRVIVPLMKPAANIRSPFEALVVTDGPLNVPLSNPPAKLALPSTVVETFEISHPMMAKVAAAPVVVNVTVQDAVEVTEPTHHP